LVGKIRFPLMDEEYLRSRVVGMSPADDAEWMEGVVAEALRAKAAGRAGADFEFELLGPKALDHRVGLGVKWEEYANGGERRLKGHTDIVLAVAKFEGRVCSGSEDGSIRVWHTMGEAAAHVRTLAPAGSRDPVNSLAVCEGRLISGHGSGRLRVWNVATGACDQALRGHAPAAVHALAVCGPRLASGSADNSVKVWAMGADGRYACERTLRGHTGRVRSLAAWQGKVLSGSWDNSIRVWDAGTGAHDATLDGHGSTVYGLAVHGDRLFSASADGRVRVWALGTWAALRTVRVGGRGAPQYPRCLAVSGSQLVGGMHSIIGSQGGLRVWDLETLTVLHKLPQPPGAGVWALLGMEGAVWAGLGGDVAVWRHGV
jgi:WD40 repeat protein